MLILAPPILMSLAALILVGLRLIRPGFRYPWMIAVGASTLSLVFVVLWQLHLPQNFSITTWQPISVFSSSPEWLADRTSWPYALALAALVVAVIWTSVVRTESDSVAWAGTLILGALGILSVTAGNPLTLVLVWSAIDLSELVARLRFASGEQQYRSAVVAFSIRLVGSALVIWAGLLARAAGSIMDFRAIPASVGLYLLAASLLRLGILPLSLPYRQVNFKPRGLGTTLQLVSAAASISLLARVPPTALLSSLPPILLILTASTGLYASWQWLRASDEMLGRPFWILGVSSLSLAASLRGSPAGSVGWGVTLILSGGLLFLFSARERRILWLPLIGLWGLSALPFSPSSSAWLSDTGNSWLFILPFIPVQALLIAGYIRQALHPGELSLESQAKWIRVLFPAGLLILAGASILLGIWGWAGARILGLWWISLLALLLAAGATYLSLTVLPRFHFSGLSPRWSRLLSFNWLVRYVSWIFSLFRSLAGLITTSLEGEGGVLWSLVLLALILSILTNWGY